MQQLGSTLPRGFAAGLHQAATNRPGLSHPLEKLAEAAKADPVVSTLEHQVEESVSLQQIIVIAHYDTVSILGHHGVRPSSRLPSNSVYTRLRVIRSSNLPNISRRVALDFREMSRRALTSAMVFRASDFHLPTSRGSYMTRIPHVQGNRGGAA